MKKKTFLTTLSIAAVAIISGYGGMRSFLPQDLDRKQLLSENIEALSGDETSQKKQTCYNTITAKDGCMVRYCVTCKFVPGTDPWYAPSDECPN